MRMMFGLGGEKRRGGSPSGNIGGAFREGMGPRAFFLRRSCCAPFCFLLISYHENSVSVNCVESVTTPLKKRVSAHFQ